MIKVENLKFRYSKKEIFNDVSFEIPDDKLTILLGSNGVGKSTLFKIITGNLSSSCKINNTFKNIFYLPQNPYYPKGITTFDYLSSNFFKNNWKWYINREEKQKIDNVLAKVGLSDKRNLNIENLSGGEIQKANIALGLLSGADLFLLDEPASNMDLSNQIKILKLLSNLTKNKISSVIIMHDINLSLRFGEFFLGIDNNGNIIQSNSFFDIKELNQIFKLEFKIVKDMDKRYVQILD